MDRQKNKTVVEVLTVGLNEARRRYRDKTEALQQTIRYRGNVEKQLQHATAQEVRTATECQTIADQITDLEEGLQQFGVTV